MQLKIAKWAFFRGLYKRFWRPMRIKTSDMPSKPPVEGGVKGPKGSKLDSKKRTEYEAEVGRAESWDTSSWPIWTVTGRILPERCNVQVPATVSRGVGAGGKFKLRLEVICSHIAALCAFEKAEPSVFELADIVRSAVAFPVDYIAFQVRGAYEIVLDLCINQRTGETWAIPIFEPMFEVDDAELCFKAQDDKRKVAIPWEEASKVVEFQVALHDLISAVRYPPRTFEYCRMAVEIMRRYFDPKNARNHKEKWRYGEINMCSALNLTRESLLSLDAVAARSRHGELILSIDWEMRKRALEFTWELVARFENHLQGRSNSQWRKLDVKIEL